MIIEDNFKREVLNEGRNYGFGFSFLKKDKNKYVTLMPFSACKDYLNDFVYIEHTNKQLPKIHGFKHKYTGNLNRKRTFYLGVRALHYKHGKKYEKFDDIDKYLKENHTNLIKLLNKIEEFFKLKTRTKIENYIDGVLILKVPIFWSKFTFLISLYTLLIRCFVDINEKTLNENIKDIIEKKNNNLIIADNMLYQTVKKFFKEHTVNKLLKYKYPEDLNNTPYIIHNFGISNRISQLRK